MKIEELIVAGALEPMIAADLDMVNMFGNAEWPFHQGCLAEPFSRSLALDNMAAGVTFSIEAAIWY